MRFILILLAMLFAQAATGQPGSEPVADPLSTGDDQAVIPDSSLAGIILAEAMSFLGTPYVYGGTGPDGFDCSGLVYRVFGDHGVELPRTAGGMETMGSAVALEELEPGDLLIFNSPKHVGIYIGDGNFIHSSSWQGRGVVITSLDQENYTRRYSAARRVL
jgi:cell wall-associated NlpC family hydrolase